MRWILVLLAVIAVIVAVVFVGGLLLPVHHVAAMRTNVPAPPDSVYSALADVRSAPAWRADVDSVRILSVGDDSLRWMEAGRFGVIRFVREEERAPARLVNRIDGTGQGFGGKWTWQLEPTAGGTIVTVTEAGEVYNPAFRFLSRFVFGHHSTMESFLHDLGRRFGADIRTERIES